MGSTTIGRGGHLGVTKGVYSIWHYQYQRPHTGLSLIIVEDRGPWDPHPRRAPNPPTDSVPQDYWGRPKLVGCSAA